MQNRVKTCINIYGSVCSEFNQRGGHQTMRFTPYLDKECVRFSQVFDAFAQFVHCFMVGKQ